MRPLVALLATLAAGLLGAALWQARPVLVWHLTVLPEIETRGRQARLQVRTRTSLPAPSPGWPELRFGQLSLRAPILPGQAEACSRCAEGCALELSRGRLVFIPDQHPMGYDAAAATYGPAPIDVSLWRGAAKNWATVDGLAARALLDSPPPQVFRFQLAGSRGIVTRVESLGIERHVIYLFSPDGRPAALLATSRTGPELLHQILGGIELGDRIESAHCHEEGP